MELEESDQLVIQQCGGELAPHHPTSRGNRSDVHSARQARSGIGTAVLALQLNLQKRPEFEATAQDQSQAAAGNVLYFAAPLHAPGTGNRLTRRVEVARIAHVRPAIELGSATLMHG